MKCIAEHLFKVELYVPMHYKTGFYERTFKLRKPVMILAYGTSV